MTMADRRHHEKRHGSPVVLSVALGAIVLAGLYAAGFIFYFTSQHRASSGIIKNGHVPPDLQATAQTSSFNPSTGDLVVRVLVLPLGDLVAADGSVTRAVNVQVIGGTTTKSYRYSPGDRISPVDVTIGMAGDTNAYPFDSYRSSLALDAAAAPAASSQQSAAPAVTPTLLTFEGTLSGYRVSTVSLPTSPADVNLLAVEMTVKRASVTVGFAILIVVLQGLLAVAAAALAVVMISRHRRVEIPMLTWLAALLFAIIPLRNAMPAGPPIGAEVDVVVFFWALTIITISLLVVLTTWIRQPPPP
jgi:hypothetical protein